MPTYCDFAASFLENDRNIVSVHLTTHTQVTEAVADEGIVVEVKLHVCVCVCQWHSSFKPSSLPNCVPSHFHVGLCTVLLITVGLRGGDAGMHWRHHDRCGWHHKSRLP